jgi:tetratricopeptide (TPR) repeat protein
MSEIELTRAMALHQAGDLAEAEVAYRGILSANPNDADAASYLGVLLHQLHRGEEAIDLLRQAVAIRADAAAIHSNLGIALAGAKQLADAEQSLRTALQLEPGFLPALLNLGNVLLMTGRLAEARQAYDAARRTFPNSAEAWSGLGDVCQAMHEVGPAVAAYRRAIALRNLPAARVGLASTYLLAGHLAEGWPLYEARWELSGRSPSSGFDRPRWDGSDLHGRTILLHAEQGLGDTIQFIRYAPMAKSLGGQTIVLAPALLEKFLAGQPGVDRVASDRAAVGEFDLQCPLLSLPSVFRTTLQTIPNQMPLLNVDANKAAAWGSRMCDADSEVPLNPPPLPSPGVPGEGITASRDSNLAARKPRVGIAWAGSTQHANDSKRSIAFSQIQSLLHEVDAVWISLQVERGEADPALIDWTADLRDLSDTAALIANLDLVISVDTAVAHLAGALGKPTWLLLPYSPDWRWMWQREDSPWYPTMRLFRQTTPGDWSGPIQRVATELHHVRHISR